MSNPLILQHFPTERYKRFWYPTRPLFTLATGFFIAGLGFIGILPMGWALWLSAAFAFDDLPLTPIMALLTSTNNLYHGRKKLKSITTLIAISMATIIGTLLAVFVLSHSAPFMALISGFIAATSCSPVLISIGAISGGVAAHFTNKISPFWGIIIGVLIFSFLPIPVPLKVDVVFICAAASAFVTSIVIKQALRLYYKLSYGHTNADGYGMNKSEQELANFIEKQAEKFDVSPEQFSSLIQYCEEQIQIIKNEASLYQEFTGQRQPRSNSFKDVRHALMNPNATPADIKAAKSLLKISQINYVATTKAQYQSYQIDFFKQYTTSGTLRNDLDTRETYHIFSIDPGIPKKLTDPFLPKTPSPSASIS